MTQIITAKGGGGSGGGGEGDMKKSVYDPQDIGKDAFDYDNFTNTPDLSGYQTTANMVTSLTGADDDHYPTAKAVADAISGGGSGNVVGPASSTDEDVVVFDGATGKIIKDSGVKLSSKLDASALSNNNYGGAWENDSTHTPTKGALYDKIHTMDVEIGNKAADTSVVKLTGNQTIAGTKTFSTSPVVPSKTADATNTGTAIATEAQVYNVEQKIPSVIDDLTSTSSTSALSANQGKVLNDKISDLFGLGKFLSTWDATTGQPDSFPLETPYTYTTGDYYLVSTISSATPPVNYKPSGSSYTGAASSTTESEELAVGDIYIYDGTNWLLQLNHGKTVSFSEIAGQPTDNANLSTALSAKANDDAVVKLTGNQTIQGVKTYQSSPIVPAPTNNTDAATKKYVDDNIASATQGAVSDTAYGSSWDGVTGIAPSKNAVYDKMESLNQVPSGGNNGDVLTNVSGTPTWAAPSGGDVMVSSQSGNILTSGMKIWAGTEADYGNLGTYDNNTVYLTI